MLPVSRLSPYVIPNCSDLLNNASQDTQITSSCWMELDGDRSIPCLDIIRAVSTWAAFSDFTRSQAVRLSMVVSQIPVNMPAAGKAAA